MVSCIAFDFGGVYFTYNTNKLIAELAKELGENPKNVLHAWNKKLDDFSEGKCDETIFWDSFLKSLNREYSKDRLHDIVINHFQPIAGMRDLVRRLRNKYKVGLLTTQTTWLYDINNNYNFLKEFDFVINSYDVGVQKPSNRIFEIMVNKSKTDPDDIILIDDSGEYRRNVENYGIHFIHFRDIGHLRKDLVKIGVKT